MCLALLYFMHKKKRLFLYLSFFSSSYRVRSLLYIIMCKRAFCHEMDVVINFFSIRYLNFSIKNLLFKRKSVLLQTNSYSDYDNKVK